MLHRRFLLIIAASSLAFTPATAFAASATQDAYEPDDTGVNAETDEEPADETPTAAAAPSATGTSALPFTGMEAGLIAVAGLGLAGTGVALRRVGREQL